MTLEKRTIADKTQSNVGNCIVCGQPVWLDDDKEGGKRALEMMRAGGAVHRRLCEPQLEGKKEEG